MGYGVPITATDTTHGAALYSKAQHIIPRYYDGAHFPAGGFRGVGPSTILTGNANTHSQTRPAIVITEDSENVNLCQWQYTGTLSPGVLKPRLMDCCVAGWSVNDGGVDTPGWLYTGAVSAVPQQYNQGSPTLYDGAYLRGSGGLVENVSFFYIPGTALQTIRVENALQGATLPGDCLQWTVQHVKAHRVFAGINMNSVDTTASEIEVFGFRDYGFKVNGAVQFNRVHTYGGGYTATSNVVLDAEQPHCASIWMHGDENHGSDCYGESAPVGLLIDGRYNDMKGFSSRLCWAYNVYFTNQENTLRDARIHNGYDFGTPTNQIAVCIGATASFNRLVDCLINFVAATGGIGIQLLNGYGHHIKGVIVDAYNQNSSSGPTGLVCATNMNHCRIDLHVIGGGVGLDLSSATIGVGNFINYTHSGEQADSAMHPYEPYLLPGGTHGSPNGTWSTTPSANANQIWINGTRYYG